RPGRRGFRARLQREPPLPGAGAAAEGAPSTRGAPLPAFARNPRPGQLSLPGVGAHPPHARHRERHRVGAHGMGPVLVLGPEARLLARHLGIYVVLLQGRMTAGWRGRWAATLTIAGFAVIVLSLVGVNVLA